MVAAQAALLLLSDLRQHLEIGLLILAFAFAGLALAIRRLARLSQARRLTGRPLLAVMGVAVALRLLAVPLPPTLSDDVARYLWDGRVLAAGASPWRLAPDAPELASLRDAAWRELPHKAVPSVYPPLASALFALVGFLPRPLLAWKCLVAGADLLGCWWLLCLAAKLELPPLRALWFAWSPLLVLEGAGMGHLDGLGVTAAIGAALALLSRAPVRAGLAAAAGALLKLAPLAALPLWARRSERPGWLVLSALLAFGLGALPMLASAGLLPDGLATYGMSWEFNGPLFEPLWRIADALGLAPWLASGLDALKGWTGHRQDAALNRLYPYLYPQLLTKAGLGGLALLVVLASWFGARRRGLAESHHRLFGGLLLTSATVYPWYLLWVLPWAALALEPAWLLASGLVLLSYLPQHRPGASGAFWFCAQWIPFAIVALAPRRLWGHDELA